MFKKADKNELRTWIIGSIMMFLLCSVIGIVLLADMFTVGFKIGNFIFSIVCVLSAMLFFRFVVNSIKAYKTFDERKQAEKEENDRKQKEDAIALEEKIKREKKEMETIRVQEEARARNNALELEKMKKEALGQNNEKKR